MRYYDGFGKDITGMVLALRSRVGDLEQKNLELQNKLKRRRKRKASEVKS